MAKYFVVWAGEDGVIIQSEVETICDPLMMTPHDWVMLAAEPEECYRGYVSDLWMLYCVIDYPTTFYQ